MGRARSSCGREPSMGSGGVDGRQVKRKLGPCRAPGTRTGLTRSQAEAGATADRRGRRAVFAAGLAAFTACSALCAAAGQVARQRGDERAVPRRRRRGGPGRGGDVVARPARARWPRTRRCGTVPQPRGRPARTAPRASRPRRAGRRRSASRWAPIASLTGPVSANESGSSPIEISQSRLDTRPSMLEGT